MNQDQEEIRKQILSLSRLLSMIPADDKIIVHGSPAQNDMIISDWLDEIRATFLKLSIEISKELDIPLQYKIEVVLILSKAIFILKWVLPYMKCKKISQIERGA